MDVDQDFWGFSVWLRSEVAARLEVEQIERAGRNCRERNVILFGYCIRMPRMKEKSMVSLGWY